MDVRCAGNRIGRPAVRANLFTLTILGLDFTIQTEQEEAGPGIETQSSDSHHNCLPWGIGLRSPAIWDRPHALIGLLSRPTRANNRQACVARSRAKLTANRED
ncbi:hypothetical protein PoB_007629400 [Plakobranchus ocellatus]|uniref:Uncharacterized protein n=1 Tax=Plakobranchus ocellatus TaxID=259542 RepID=A0AAV4E0G3_9GAST|nr:hypothetical protein PoB_007629400 [Plakobranchus ocellatus]